MGLFFDEIHQLHAPLRQQHAEETPRSGPQANCFLGWSYWCQYMARALPEQKVPGPQSPVCSRGGGHQRVQARPVSPKQVTHSRQACGNASSKLAWLCPAPQAVPIHQLSCRLPARLSAVVACQRGWKCHRQADRAGVWRRHLRGASRGTVMNEATRDDIPGILAPSHTSGKLRQQSSCGVPTVPTVSSFQESLTMDHRNPGQGRGACAS